MKIHFIEAHDATEFNWGKFLLGKMDDAEWSYQSQVSQTPLLAGRGWSKDHLWILDLQTGEGFYCRPGGLAVADLEKHKVWVCPMFEPFLVWLYQQDLSDISKLPSVVNLGNVPTALQGYRRKGKKK